SFSDCEALGAVDDIVSSSGIAADSAPRRSASRGSVTTIGVDARAGARTSVNLGDESIALVPERSVTLTLGHGSVSSDAEESLAAVLGLRFDDGPDREPDETRPGTPGLRRAGSHCGIS